MSDHSIILTSHNKAPSSDYSQNPAFPTSRSILQAPRALLGYPRGVRLSTDMPHQTHRIDTKNIFFNLPATTRGGSSDGRASAAGGRLRVRVPPSSLVP